MSITSRLLWLFLVTTLIACSSNNKPTDRDNTGGNQDKVSNSPEPGGSTPDENEEDPFVYPHFTSYNFIGLPEQTGIALSRPDENGEYVIEGADCNSRITDINSQFLGAVVAEGGTYEGTLNFSLVGGADRQFFTINQDTGELHIKEGKDFDKPQDANGDNHYELRVEINPQPPTDETPNEKLSSFFDITVEVENSGFLSLRDIFPKAILSDNPNSDLITLSGLFLDTDVNADDKAFNIAPVKINAVEAEVEATPYRIYGCHKNEEGKAESMRVYRWTSEFVTEPGENIVEVEYQNLAGESKIFEHHLTASSVSTGTFIFSQNALDDEIMMCNLGGTTIHAYNWQTGLSRVVSSNSIGTGDSLSSCAALSLNPETKQLYVLDDLKRVMLEIDTETGDRSTLAQNIDINAQLADMAIDLENEKLLTIGSNAALKAIDIATGTISNFSDENTGNGPLLSEPSSISVADDRAYVIGDEFIYSVDLANGNREELISFDSAMLGHNSRGLVYDRNANRFIATFVNTDLSEGQLIAFDLEQKSATQLLTLDSENLYTPFDLSAIDNTKIIVSDYASGKSYSINLTDSSDELFSPLEQDNSAIYARAFAVEHHYSGTYAWFFDENKRSLSAFNIEEATVENRFSISLDRTPLSEEASYYFDNQTNMRKLYISSTAPLVEYYNLDSGERSGFSLPTDMFDQDSEYNFQSIHVGHIPIQQIADLDYLANTKILASEDYLTDSNYLTNEAQFKPLLDFLNEKAISNLNLVEKLRYLTGLALTIGNENTDRLPELIEQLEFTGIADLITLKETVDLETFGLLVGLIEANNIQTLEEFNTAFSSATIVDLLVLINRRDFENYAELTDYLARVDIAEFDALLEFGDVSTLEDVQALAEARDIADDIDAPDLQTLVDTHELRVLIEPIIPGEEDDKTDVEQETEIAKEPNTQQVSILQISDIFTVQELTKLIDESAFYFRRIILSYEEGLVTLDYPTTNVIAHITLTDLEEDITGILETTLNYSIDMLYLAADLGSEKQEIFKFDLKTNEISQLTNNLNLAPLHHLEYSTDDDRIIALGGNQSAELLSIDPENGNKTPLSNRQNGNGPMFDLRPITIAGRSLQLENSTFAIDKINRQLYLSTPRSNSIFSVQLDNGNRIKLMH